MLTPREQYFQRVFAEAGRDNEMWNQNQEKWKEIARKKAIRMMIEKSDDEGCDISEKYPSHPDDKGAIW